MMMKQTALKFLPWRRRRQAGFSLVEVMITLAILAIVLLVFLSIMTSASTTSAVSKENAIAISILQSSMEDIYSNAYGAFWDNYFNLSGVFSAIYSDPLINTQTATITALAPRVQGTGAPLTAAERVTWANIVNLFKTHPYQNIPVSNRLRNESINLYLLPTSDIYSGAAFNTSPQNTDHGYVEYMVEVLWTDATGKKQHESITTRRSQ